MEDYVLAVHDFYQNGYYGNGEEFKFVSKTYFQYNFICKM